jgi:hypothetical protein
MSPARPTLVPKKANRVVVQFMGFAYSLFSTYWGEILLQYSVSLFRGNTPVVLGCVTDSPRVATPPNQLCFRP